MHNYLALALILIVAAPAGADDGAKTIAPFLDEHTFAVARIDLTKVNADALFTAFGPFNDIDTDGVKSLQAKMDHWMSDLTKAGGRELFLVFSLADTPQMPFLVVPLREGADPQAIAKGLGQANLLGAGAGEKIGGAVVAGSRGAKERLSSLKPFARPELAKAFAAAGDGAVQIAFIPPPHLVRVFDEMMPMLPKEIGGGSSKVLSRGIQWAALGLDAPPKMALRLTVQSENAKAAAALNDAIDKALKALGEQKPVRVLLPDFDKIRSSLTPKVEDDRLGLHLDQKEAHALFQPLVRYFVRAAGLEEATRHLKEIMLATITYADVHQGTMPSNLSDKSGKPLLSWRVAILPLLGDEGKALYRQFNIEQPWDSEQNRKLIAKMPQVFAGRNAKLNEQGKTVYLAPTGERTAWPSKPLTYPANFSDGTSQTILFVLADDAHAVEWTKPDDLPIDPANAHAGLGQLAGQLVFGMADGSVHTTKPTIRKENLWAAFTPNANDTPGSDW